MQNQVQQNSLDHGPNAKRVRMSNANVHQNNPLTQQQQEYMHQQSQQQMLFNNAQQNYQQRF